MIVEREPDATEAEGRLRRVLLEELGSLELGRLLAHAVCALLPEDAFGRLRAALLRACGLRLGPGAMIWGAVRIHGPRGALRRLTVGRRCLFTTPLFLDLASEIRIGDQVSIGHHVRLVTSDHEIGRAAWRCAHLHPRPITIGDGCWIGAGAMILPGVVLGRGSVVAAGAVVRANVPENALVGGVPARLIRMLPG